MKRVKARKVRIVAMDPTWNYATCAHPVIGSIAHVLADQTAAPEGKVLVAFRSKVHGVYRDGTSTMYLGCRASPLRLFLPVANVRTVRGR